MLMWMLMLYLCYVYVIFTALILCPICLSVGGAFRKATASDPIDNDKTKNQDKVLFYLIGLPGSGKSSIMAKILEGYGKGVYNVHRAKKGNPLHLTTGYNEGITMLGYWRKDFSGTDTLSFGIKSVALEYMSRHAGFYVGEGDRLTSQSFFEELAKDGYGVHVVYVNTDKDECLKRIKARGDVKKKKLHGTEQVQVRECDDYEVQD